MPLTTVLCACDGVERTVEECRERARSGEGFLAGCPFHYAAIKTITTERDIKEVTATELLSCARRWFLQREHEYSVNPAERWRLYRGTSTHTAIEVQTGETGEWLPCPDCNGQGAYMAGTVERSWTCPACDGEGHVQVENPIIAERRFYRTVELDGNPVTVSGQVDIFWPKIGVIADHKDKVYAAVKGDAQPEHVLQLSIYAWLIQGEGQYPTPTKGGVYYQDGKRPILKRFDLLPLDYVEQFVITRLREYAGKGNGVYPVVLQDPEDVQRMCHTCHVRNQCAALAREGR